MSEGNEKKSHGRFVVRVPRSLHTALVAEAKREGVSMNHLIVAKLGVALGDLLHRSTGPVAPEHDRPDRPERS